MRISTFLTVGGLAGVLAGACSDSGADCSPGTEGCVCTMNGACVQGLDCVGNECVPEPDTTDSTTDSSTTDASTTGDDTGSTGGQPSGPLIESFEASVTSITEGDSVTFTAEVTDPDGVEDIASAILEESDSETVYGELTGDGTGTFTLTMTWAEIHAVDPINFDKEIMRSFLLTVTDTTSLSNVAMTSLKLTCASQDACDGSCVDTLVSDEHCGVCGNACVMGGDIGGCDGNGACVPALWDCIDDTVTSCADYCTSVGETCVQGGCGTATYVIYDDAQTCADHTAAVAQGTPCDTPINWTLNGGSNVGRCCCTDVG